MCETSRSLAGIIVCSDCAVMIEGGNRAGISSVKQEVFEREREKYVRPLYLTGRKGDGEEDGIECELCWDDAGSWSIEAKMQEPPL